jgi:hypothetical protein
MKQLLIGLLISATLIAVFGSCKKADKGIYISFINATGTPVKDVKVNSKSIGNLEDNTETAPVFFEQFYGFTHAPICSFSGQVNNALIENYPFDCGTPPIPTLKAGYYTMIISSFQMQGETFFSLRFR